MKKEERQRKAKDVLLRIPQASWKNSKKRNIDDKELAADLREFHKKWRNISADKPKRCKTKHSLGNRERVQVESKVRTNIL